MMSLSYSPENWARRLLQVSCYFCPAPGSLLRQKYVTSLGRWMLLAHSLKVIAHKQPLNNWGQRCFIFFLWSASWMGMAHDSVRRGRIHPALTLKSSQLFENPTHWILSQKLKISNYTHIIVAFSVLQWGHTLCSGENRLNDNQIQN